MKSLLSVFATLALIVAVPAAGQGLRPMTSPDQFAVRDVGEIRIAPDASSIVFSVTTTDLAANRTTTTLMRVGAGGGTPTELAGVPASPANVRWSPDSTRLAFIADENGRSGVFVYDVASSRLTRVCDYDRGNHFVTKAGNWLSWSPDGTQIAFAGTLDPVPPAADPVVVTRLQYKTRTALSDNRRAHIYVVPATGGSPRQLTTGTFDEHSIDWGGDGSEIVFLSNHEADPDARLNYDIFAVAVGSGRIRQITRTPGVEMEPRVSPDGRLIAYTATTRAVTTIDSVAEDNHVWIVPLAGGASRELNHALDRRSSTPDWAPDSQAVVYGAADHGKNVIYRVGVAGGASVALVNQKAQAGPFSIARDGLMALGLATPVAPREVFRLRPDAPPQKITSLNDARAAGWQLVEPETVTFKSADGTPVEAWYYPPVGAAPRAPAASVPLILSIHGGPHGMFGYGFNAGFQINAARGYATLAINPRGSSGYGQAFADGCVNDWGGGDYQDLMAGVDAVLKLKPEVDPARLGVTGSSYGGFMTNWVITQTTRFKAAVSGASLSNMISFYATSLYQDLVHAEFNGFPWDDDNYATLWKWSPLAHVKAATTPTLFIHGERDNDVHITQAEEMFTALRRRGVESALARYPREGHGFREPKHTLDRTDRTLDWMDKFLKPGPKTAVSR